MVDIPKSDIPIPEDAKALQDSEERGINSLQKETAERLFALFGQVFNEWMTSEADLTVPERLVAEHGDLIFNAKSVFDSMKKRAASQALRNAIKDGVEPKKVVEDCFAQIIYWDAKMKADNIDRFLYPTPGGQNFIKELKSAKKP